MDKTWYGVDVDAAQAAGEAVEYALMEAGALGTETNTAGDGPDLVITGYFDHEPPIERVRAALAEALRIYQLPSSSVPQMELRQVIDKDWLGEWKKSWQPQETDRFVIAPPWTEVSRPDRIVIRIEPGMAFGTGTHETTRLCLQAIEKHFQGGSFLDVGTGTGLLAIAAAKLFPEADVQAFDVDASAVEIAQENAKLNGVSDRITFAEGSIDDATASADFVCANLTADVITDLLPLLIAVTCGRLVLSGILVTQMKLVLNRLNDCGAPGPVETLIDGEWAAIVI